MDIHKQSLDILKEHQLRNGSFPTFPGERTPAYHWLRDATFCAYALDLWNEIELAEKFYKAMDKKLMSTTWNNIDVVGYGTFLWGFGKHITRSENSLEDIKPTVNMIQKYLLSHWEGINTAVGLAGVYAGLEEIKQYCPCSNLEEVLEKIKDTLIKKFTNQGAFFNFKDTQLATANLILINYPFNIFKLNNTFMKKTYNLIKAQIAEEIKRQDFGGDLRSELLTYFAFLGCSALTIYDYKFAEELYYWLQEQTDPEGFLPDRHHQWFDHQNEIITPFLPSHAAYLIFENELKKFIKS